MAGEIWSIPKRNPKITGFFGTIHSIVWETKLSLESFLTVTACTSAVKYAFSNL
jgi:hypothetical protein